MFLKNIDELNNLSIDELICLYFQTSKEILHPSVMFDGVDFTGAYEAYKGRNRNQLNVISKILKSKNISTNYFYLTYKLFKIKYRNFKNK